MRAVVMHEPGNVTVDEMPMPTILEPTDAIIKLAATCICGSDLWPYRGFEPVHEQRMGHEYVGTVIEVGEAVTTVKPRRLRRRVLLYFLRRVRDLPRRLPLSLCDRLRARRHLRQHPRRRYPSRIRTRGPRRWHSGEDPRSPHA